MFQITLGVDIAKKKFDVVLFLQGKYKHQHFPNDKAGFEAFIQWIQAFNLSAKHR
ncbi:MAG: hypothetical protein ACRER2_10110 [Methylococcales bacterium]